MSMTPEQKKAASERMKAYHEAKKTKVEQEEGGAHPEPKDQEALHQELADLKKIVEEMKQAQYTPKPDQATPQMNQSGKLVGVFEKYVVDPAYYPDPRERLRKEAKLQPFAFDFNYELGWDVSTSNYETKDGINTKEPKFTLELNRIMMDEDTGEATNKRYTVCRAIFHEDPQAAIVVARDNGIDVDETNERDFLNEMRYLQMRDWLLEAFYPPKSTQEKVNKVETVIGNTLVEVFEINSESSESIPFDKLNKKF